MGFGTRSLTYAEMLFFLLFYGTPPADAQAKVVVEQVSFAEASGELRLPETSSQKLPAVVVLHTAGGLSDKAGAPYIEALNRAGIATLEPEFFQRGGAPKFPRLNLPHTYGSLSFLANHPRVDPQRIGVMGFSWGAYLSLISVSAELTEVHTGGKYGFAAHLPVYPVCYVQSRILDGKNSAIPASVYAAVTGAPVHILAGERDHYDEDPDTCPRFVRGLPENVRRHVSVTVYPGAYHGWDTQLNQRYFDPVAYKGRGGWVVHSRSAETAAKSVQFAVEFFKTHLSAK